jgi:hypothetical protein
VLPDSDYDPATSSKLLGYSLITSAIGDYTVFPEITVRFWHFEVNWAAMPKTTIYKYGNPFFSKRKIGRSQNGQMSSPSLDALASQ